jgi:HlyD family secretion protein
MTNKKYRRRRCLLAVYGACGILAFSGCPSQKPGQKAYEFTAVRRGTLERSVSSSGTINPVSTVKVLPRMSGKVEKVYVDYNDTVSRGDVLAELNTDMLRLQREQQSAQVVKARAAYELQEINYRNQEALAEKHLISEYELKTGKTTLDIEGANLAAAEANLRAIETEINQYAFITSPIDGIVLERNINEGDTVVDSSNSNSTNIFTLAENLREMRIEAAVGELDVASIRKGQAVRFTLESLPGRNFTGTVETLHLIPAVQNNVVSYTVIIGVENHDGSLLPGMTCSVDFVVEQKENVLLVPNAALRYQPTGLSAEALAEMVFNAGIEGLDDEQRKAAIEARAQSQAASGQTANAPSGMGLAGMVTGNVPARGGRLGGGPGNAAARQPASARRGSSMENAVVMRNLWFITGEGKLDLLRVRTGISNGTDTEIVTTDDIEGARFILRERI